jgi:hypothetical protein
VDPLGAELIDAVEALEEHREPAEQVHDRIDQGRRELLDQVLVDVDELAG